MSASEKSELVSLCRPLPPNGQLCLSVLRRNTSRPQCKRQPPLQRQPRVGQSGRGAAPSQLAAQRLRRGLVGECHRSDKRRLLLDHRPFPHWRLFGDRRRGGPEPAGPVRVHGPPQLGNAARERRDAQRHWYVGAAFSFLFSPRRRQRKQEPLFKRQILWGGEMCRSPKRVRDDIRGQIG